MPLARQTVERFLAVTAEAPLSVKGVPPAELDAMMAQYGKVPRFKTAHRLQQHEALAFALHNRRALLFYEMRTGKTKISLDWLTFLFYNKMIRKALIIAHAPVAVGTWETEIVKHSHLRVTSVVSGRGSWEVFCDAVENPKVQAVLITWSTLQALFTIKKENRKGNNQLYADAELIRAATRHFDAVIIDEIHMAMNPETLRFDVASLLVDNCHWRLGLTGTPVGRDPFGLWAQLYLIDDGARLGRLYPFFVRAMGKQIVSKFRPSGFEWVFDDRKLPLLRDKIKDIILECKLSDMHEVNIIKSVIPLTMSRAQINAYKEIIDDIRKFKAGETVKFENAFIRCRQISSGWRPYTDENGYEKIRELTDPCKFVWLGDLLENIGDAIKMVIFHEYIHTGYRLCQLLEKQQIKYGWLYGGAKDRAELIARFQVGDIQVLVANAATGGTGTNFSAADYLCFFESPSGVITRRQAEFRPLARGSRPLVIDDLVCSPVERRILEFHEQGSSLAELLRKSPQEIAAALSL